MASGKLELDGMNSCNACRIVSSKMELLLRPVGKSCSNIKFSSSEKNDKESQTVSEIDSPYLNQYSFEYTDDTGLAHNQTVQRIFFNNDESLLKQLKQQEKVINFMYGHRP
ncbi:hypothetical protein HDU92_003120, partial [Lobulomyces angularis]